MKESMVITIRENRQRLVGVVLILIGFGAALFYAGTRYGYLQATRQQSYPAGRYSNYPPNGYLNGGTGSRPHFRNRPYYSQPSATPTPLPGTNGTSLN